MAGVPYVFGNATTSIPLTNLDANFNTGVTIGNTTVGLGNTVTTLGNVTLTNSTVFAASVTDSGLTSGRVTFAGTGGLLTDSGNFNYSVGTLTLGTVAATANNIQMTGSTTAGTYLQMTTTGGIFSTGLDNSTGSVFGGSAYSSNLYMSGAYPMLFWTSGAERMRINAGAPILCLAGGSTTATGTGIAFPATQSASSDANTLDDYEEGTCTLTMTLGISGTITLTSGAGGDLAYYTKIGRVVTVTAALAIASVSSPLGEIKINGLPFTVFNSNANYTGVSLFASGWAAGATACLQAYANRGSTVMGLDTYIAGASNGAGSYAQAGATLYLSVTYQSA